MMIAWKAVYIKHDGVIFVTIYIAVTVLHNRDKGLAIKPLMAKENPLGSSSTFGQKMMAHNNMKREQGESEFTGQSNLYVCRKFILNFNLAHKGRFQMHIFI